MSVVLTTTSETEAGLELLVTVATPDTQQDLVIEGTFQTGIRKAMGKAVFSKLLHSNYFLGGKVYSVCFCVYGCACTCLYITSLLL